MSIWTVFNQYIQQLYPEADSKNRCDTSKGSGHTTVQTQNTIILDDLLETISCVLVDTLTCLQTHLDKVKGLTMNKRVSIHFLISKCSCYYFTLLRQRPYHRNHLKERT